MGYTIETEIGGSYGPPPCAPTTHNHAPMPSSLYARLTRISAINLCRLLRAADEPQNALDDTYLRLYDTDGETVLDENDDELVGKESLIHWICQKTGCDGLVTITV